MQTYKCSKCGHQWTQPKVKGPFACPKCKEGWAVVVVK